MKRAVVALALLLPACSPDHQHKPHVPARFTGMAVTAHAPAADSLPPSMPLFASNDTVYALVATRGGPGMVTVSCTEESGQPVDASSQVSADGGGVCRFRFAPPHGWRSGRYVVQALVDGTPVEVRSFQCVPALPAP